MKNLTDNFLLFEFRRMGAEKAEKQSNDLLLPFVLLVDENGVGHYESRPESISKLTIDFMLSADGQQVSVTHTGELPMSCDGVYEFAGNELEVSEKSSAAILDYLPTAATSLNSLNGAYTIHYPEQLVNNWFYPVQATFDDSGQALEKFVMKKNLSAVYRVDDDIKPVLIYGSAQLMLDAKTDLLSKKSTEPNQKTLPLVSVVLDGGTCLVAGNDNETAKKLKKNYSFVLNYC